MQKNIIIFYFFLLYKFIILLAIAVISVTGSAFADESLDNKLANIKNSIVGSDVEISSASAEEWKFTPLNNQKLAEYPEEFEFINPRIKSMYDKNKV